VGVHVNVKILDNFANHASPALGWHPDSEGPAAGNLID